MTGSRRPFPTQAVNLFLIPWTPRIRLAYIRTTTSAVSLLSSLVFIGLPSALTGDIDAIIDCNVLYLSHAFSNATWNYQFAPSFVLVDVGYHGLDLCWTFFPNMIMNFSGSANLCQSRKWDYPTQAHYFQLYLLSFVKYGDPNTGRDPSTPEFKQFGTSKYYIELKGNSFTLLEPDTELPDDRCAFWQPAPYE